MDGAGQHLLAGAGFAEMSTGEIKRATGAMGRTPGSVGCRARGRGRRAQTARFTRRHFISTRRAQHRRWCAVQAPGAGSGLQAVQLGGAAHGHQQAVGMPGLEQVLVDAGVVDAGDDVRESV